MPVEKHDLAHEFPEYRDQIHQPKMTGQHFSNLFEEYHDVDHEVRRSHSPCIAQQLSTAL